MLWFQRYELLERRTLGNSVKLKTTFNLSRELLAPPEPPSPRRVNFSLLLGFHLAAVFVTRGTIYAGSIRVPHLLLTCSRSLLPKGSSPPSIKIKYTLHVIAQGLAVRNTHSIKPDAYVLEASRAKSKEAAISLAATTATLPPFSEMC